MSTLQENRYLTVLLYIFGLTVEPDKQKMQQHRNTYVILVSL